jgi:hypothetical protein
MEDEVIEIDENGVVHDPRIDWKSRAETAESALSQAQQALRDIARGRGSCEQKYCANVAERALAALPSDTPGAQAQDGEQIKTLKEKV